MRSCDPNKKNMARQTESEMSVVSWKRLFLIALGLCGVQFCWAIQVGNTTRSLLELGLDPELVSMAWLAGPIAGIIVQPLVGTLSDRYETRMGKRTPFILAGSFFSAVALLLFGNAEQLGKWLGDVSNDVSVNSNRMEKMNVSHYGLFIAVVAFWLLDFSLNAVQGPLRALMADVAPSEQQEQGNAFFALFTGVGNLLGNVLGSIPLSEYVNFISSDICGLYSVGAVIIIVTSCICGYFANERDMLSLKNYHTSHYYLTFESSQLMEESSPFGEETRNQGQEDIGERFGMRQIMQILRDAPFPFWKLFLIQCFTWFAWFTEFVFITSWMGSEVLQGNPNAPEGSKSRLSFDYGVRMGNVGLSLQSVVAIAYSLVLPRLVKVAGIKFCYILAHFLLGFCLCWTPILTKLHSVGWSIVAIALLGIPWASTITIPWAILSRSLRAHVPERMGMYSTLFNASQCFPEILVSIVAEVRTNTHT